MDKKNLNNIVCILSFIVGALFVITNPEITGNVIGASQSGYAISSILGMILIVASLGLFIATTYTLPKKIEKTPELEHLLKSQEKKELLINTNVPKKINGTSDAQHYNELVLLLVKQIHAGNHFKVADAYKEIYNFCLEKGLTERAEAAYGGAREIIKKYGTPQDQNNMFLALESIKKQYTNTRSKLFE